SVDFDGAGLYHTFGFGSSSHEPCTLKHLWRSYIAARTVIYRFNVSGFGSLPYFAIEIFFGLLGFRKRMEIGNEAPRQFHFHDHWFAPLHGRDLLQRRVGQHLPVAPHQLVADAHHLPEHHFRRFGDADVVAFRFRHLLDAVGPFGHRRRSHDLGRLPRVALALPAYQQGRFWIRSGKL